MLRALIGVLVLFSFLHASLLPRAWAESTQPTPSEVYQAQWDMIEIMREEYPEVEVEVRWIPCGMKNAFYLPSKQMVVLCTEMDPHPGAAVLFAAHEFAHAVTHQLIDVLDEGSADEIAAVSMVRAGKYQELLEAGLYWKRKATQGHLKGDDHPSAGYRAWFFTCMGSVDTNAECTLLYYALLTKWDKRLISYV